LLAQTIVLSYLSLNSTFPIVFLPCEKTDEQIKNMEIKSNCFNITHNKKMQNKSRNNDFGLSNKKSKERVNNGFVFRNNKTGYLVEGQQRQCSNFSNIINSNISA
jgi:hypothetical protein